MRNLIEFFIRYGYFGVFLILELICFNLVVRYNQSQKEIWINSTHLYTSRVQERVENTSNYLSLQTKVDSLQQENAQLIEQIINYKLFARDNAFQKFTEADSLPYEIIPAQVVSRVSNLSNNFITINKGWDHGIEIDMGVITAQGLVGVVVAVSEHFSRVLLILNSQSMVSASVKNKNFYGLCKWTGTDNTLMELTTIPKYAEINIGDTIVTSGYSTIYPASYPLGRIEDYEVEQGGSNYIISVRLFDDPNGSDYVYITKLDHKNEMQTIIEEANE